LLDRAGHIVAAARRFIAKEIDAALASQHGHAPVVEPSTSDTLVTSDGADSATADALATDLIEGSWTWTRSGIEHEDEQPLPDGDGDESDDEDWFYDDENDEEEALLEEELIDYSDSVARVEVEGWFYADEDDSHDKA
jgi:hypothetical protein